MNAPSSLAWMLSEILHGCPVCGLRPIMFDTLQTMSPSPAWDFHRLFEFLGLWFVECDRVIC